MSVIIDIVDAVVSNLNVDGRFSENLSAVRVYTPKLDTVSSSDSTVVQVAPRERTLAPRTRQGGPVLNTYQVGIGLFKATSSSSPELTAGDDQMALLQEIADYFMKNDFAVGGIDVTVQGVSMDPIYDSAILKEESVFASVATLTLTDIR